ncbi:oxidoreductase [Cryptococcus deuterogattii LA55]|nr:oxidoreductase [Cryptococcus deuterogattii LA55]KIR89981.1 oxidoreductase [Cryptococcus deuterogattii CBS 10090]
MSSPLRNVIVVGGSYVGSKAAQELAVVLPPTHRVLLVEPHSHFHHLFAFPRFAVVPTHEHKAFIPFTSVFREPTIPNPSLHAVVRAKVNAVYPTHVSLDRAWQGETDIPYDFLAIATGTKLPAPGSMQNEDKANSVEYFKTYQEGIKAAKDIVIIGGGAVGVQMACDIKEVSPEKNVTLVQSRDHVMPRFHPKLHEIVSDRFKELGVHLVTNNRVTVPAEGFPNDGSTFSVTLKDGTSIPAQLVIPATGQIPNTQLLSTLPPSSTDSLINPANGFIRVRPTLQLQDTKYANIFAIGDIADSGAPKAARPAMQHVGVLARNVLAMIDGKQPDQEINIEPAAIHMTMGLVQNIVFRNPDTDAGHIEPFYKFRVDGKPDMGIEDVWARRGVVVNDPSEYFL